MRETFTIGGSIPLKEALIKEIKSEFQLNESEKLVPALCGDIDIDKDDFIIGVGATSILGITDQKAPVHYHLPTDWDKAKFHIRSFFDLDEIEIGRWYRYPESSKHLVAFTDIKKRCGYGAAHSGWTDYDIWSTHTMVPASEKYIVETLYEVAKHRGFEVGIRVDQTSIENQLNQQFLIGNCEINYCINRDEFWMDNILLYRKGKWAKAIVGLPIV
jgi:hypothetical protein